MSTSDPSVDTERTQVTSHLAQLTIAEYAHTAPGDFSPTTQPDYSNTPTPVLQPTSFDPNAYTTTYDTPGGMMSMESGGAGQYLYYPPGPLPPPLQPPPLLPFTQPSSATSYTFDHNTPTMPMTMGMHQEGFTAAGGFPTLQEPFQPVTPSQDHNGGGGFNRRGGAERGGRSGVYQPPHVQQQYTPHGQRHASTSTLPSPVSQGFSSYMGYNQRPMGEFWNGQASYRTPSSQMDRRRENVSRIRDIPYIPTSRGSQSQSHNPYVSGSRPPHPSLPPTPQTQIPSQSYGMMTPPSNRSVSTRNGQYSGVHTGPMGSFQFGSGMHTPLSMGMRNVPWGRNRPLEVMPFVRRSPLLDDFRVNYSNRRWSLEDIGGSVVEFSSDQHGSRFIQQQLEYGEPDDRQRIFDEILPDALKLMSDVFGNYVVQKMFEVGNTNQKARLANTLDGHVRSLALHMYGCRVIQKALDYLDGTMRLKVIQELEPFVLECVQSNNGNHVIQRLVARDPPAFMARAFLGHLRELATNVYGCRVIQKMFELLPEGMKVDLLEEMHPMCEELMQNQFGNYVVQSVLVVGSDKDRKRIIDRIKGQMFPMSRHKFASNVCEKALQHSQPEDRRILVDELIGHQKDGTTMIPVLLRDAFGNFPLQTALTCAEDDQRVELLDLIIPELPLLRTSPVGKRLEAKFSQWHADGLIDSATEAGANTLAYQERLAAGLEPPRRFSEASNLAKEGEYTDMALSDISSEFASPPFPPRDQLSRSASSTPVRPIAPEVRSFTKSNSIAGVSLPLPTPTGSTSASDDKTLESLLQ